MTFSFLETKVLIDAVLTAPVNKARDILHHHLLTIKRSEPEFYAGVLKHGPTMTYASDQWFDFLSKLPTPIFRDESTLMNKLSETQRRSLPPATFAFR